MYGSWILEITHLYLIPKCLPAHLFREHKLCIVIKLSDFQETVCFDFSVQIKNT